jgi:hypothetical protein
MSLSSSADPRSAKLKTSFLNLSKASRELNSASDTFGAAITSLDEAINELNPGVTAWVNISVSTPDEDAPWVSFEERLGYDKTKGRWGLTLCTVSVDDEESSETTAGSWLFNDAPRNLRLRAIEHLPELIEALAKEASHTAKRVTEQADYALELAKSISAITTEKGSRQ